MHPNQKSRLNLEEILILSVCLGLLPEALQNVIVLWGKFECGQKDH